MPIRQRLGLALCLCSVSLAVAAQASAIASPAAQSAIGQQTGAQAQTGTPDIVVDGEIEAQSAWRRAESAHVIVTSKGSEAELKRVTNNLERLYALMSRLYHRGDKPDDTVKLQVTLIDSSDFFGAMGLRNLRSEEGPYATTFLHQRYYDPREDGAVLAVARTDQVVNLATALAEDRDMSDSADAADADTVGGASFTTTANHAPVARAWEAVLYSAFAQHFLLTYAPAAYPRWYLDGVGALFSTMDVRRDGKIDYARAPDDYRQVFRSYGDLKVGDVLTGHYLDAAPGKTGWTPYHAWLLAHFFLFSNLKPERAHQFEQYMMAIQQGTPMAEAATVFGNLKKLQYEILAYADKSTEFARAEAPRGVETDPLIVTLSRSSAALIEERIELGSRLSAYPAEAGNEAIATARAAWLAQIRTKVGQLRYNVDAILLEAEAECRSGHDVECLAAAERVLARSPENVNALAWKGIALTLRATTGPAAQRATTLAAARGILAAAIRIDGDAPLPLIAYFQSFSDAGERVPEQAMLDIAKAASKVPAAPAPRLYLAEELRRQGQADAARRVLYPVLYGAYDSPEREVAVRLFQNDGGAQQGGQ